MREGERVRLKPDAPLCIDQPELGGIVGTVGAIVSADGDVLLNVRYPKPLNLTVMGAAEAQFDTADDLEPRLRIVV